MIEESIQAKLLAAANNDLPMFRTKVLQLEIKHARVVRIEEALARGLADADAVKLISELNEVGIGVLGTSWMTV